MSKRESKGLPGLPRKEKASADSASSSTQIIMGKPEDLEKAKNAAKIKEAKEAKAAKKAKGEDDTDAPVEKGEKKSLLKMSPAELKSHFSKKNKGDDEEYVDIEDMVFIPKDPSVNLLPKEVVDEYKAHDLKIKFAKIGGTLTFIFLVLFGVSMVSSALNQQEITALEEDAVALNLEIRQLTPYETYKMTIDGKRASLATQMQGDLDVAAILDGLNTVGEQSGIEFTTVSLDSSGAECTSADPFNSVPTIGCISFTGEGNGSGSIVQFFEAAGNIEGFVNAYLPASGAVESEEGGSVLEGGSIGITEVFYAQRNAELNIPIDDILAQNEAPAEEAAETPAEAPVEEEAITDGE